jgi:hypothetical protein
MRPPTALMPLSVDPRDPVSGCRLPRDSDGGGPSSRRRSLEAGDARHYAWWCALAVFGALLLSFPLDAPTKVVIELFTPARSEYRIYEQFTKLYLLVCILVAAAHLTFTRRSGAPFWERVTPASLLLLSTTIYLAESNMMSEAAQPLAGLLFGITTVAGLLRLRSWAALAWIIFAGGLLAVAIIIDALSHSRPSIDRGPLRDAIPRMIRAEEHWDLVAMSTLVLGTLLACRDGVLDAFRRLTPHWIAIGLVGAVLVTTSNGMMHWEYKPRRTVYMAAIPIAFAPRCCGR